MVHKIFSKKRSLISLERSNSVKHVSLKGKIVVGYCRGNDTIIFLFFIYGFKEKTIRLYGKDACQQL